jgi:hypothetical protein
MTETFVDTPTSWIVGFVCSAIGFSLSSYNIFKHSRTYTQPNKQRAIIRILGIVPVYCVGSWLSLVFFERALYFDTIRDIYEAWVIYSFLNLILAYGGGENECCLAMANNPGSINHPCPLCFLPPIQLGSNFLRACKRGCLQFVVIKPLFAVFSIIMYEIDQFDAPWYQWFLQLVYNLSYTIALYALLLFYLATREVLSDISPVFKFFAVKIVVFATYYQSLAVAAVPGIPHETSQRWNNFILCCEMSIFAILHSIAYPWKEFTQGAMVTSFYSAFADAVNIKDVGRDLGTNFNNRYSAYASAHGGAIVSPAPAIALTERTLDQQDFADFAQFDRHEGSRMEALTPQSPGSSQYRAADTSKATTEQQQVAEGDDLHKMKENDECAEEQLNDKIPDQCVVAGTMDLKEQNGVAEIEAERV